MRTGVLLLSIVLVGAGVCAAPAKQVPHSERPEVEKPVGVRSLLSFEERRPDSPDPIHPPARQSGGRSLLAVEKFESPQRVFSPRQIPSNLVARTDTAPPPHKAAILPDLTIDRDELEVTLHITRENMDDDCLVDGGCIPSTGTHTLLRFATRTPNIAPEGGDLVIGPPPLHATPGLGLVREKTITANGVAIQWEWHPCHKHWHLIGYVDAQLLFAANMSEATSTVKHSFCLRDTACTRPGASPKFTCDNQGITAGCHDTYGVNVACQWIIVDGLPLDEDYVLRLTVDPTNFIPESDEKNNAVEVYFRLEDIPSSARDIEIDAMLWIVAIVLVCEFMAQLKGGEY